MAKNKVDPRSSEREIKFADVPKIKLDGEENLFEITALLTMLFSIFGVWMEWKFFAWFSLSMAVMNIANFRPGSEVKQIFSSLMISVAALYMLVHLQFRVHRSMVI